MEIMKIKFKTTLLDIQKNYFQYFVEDLKKRILIFVLAPMLLAYLIDYDKEINLFILYTILIEFVFIILLITPYLIAYFNILKRTKKNPDFYNEKTITLSDTGISIEYENSNEIIFWESIISLKTNNDYISIIFTNNIAIFIPVRSFANELEVSNFIGIIKNNVSKVQNSIGIIKSNDKPPYFVGLFGIIPIIGAFVGASIVIAGIFKYKNIGFTLIGIPGIVFTILIFSGIFTPETKKEDPSKLIPIVKVRLDAIIKDIEYYKIEHGKYPDSLTQVNSYQIYDPVQSYTEKLKTFVYHLDGEKYLLFSSGFDGKEGTQDDIYPEILPTSKVGLKKYSFKK